jgi:hypothetical protein
MLCASTGRAAGDGDGALICEPAYTWLCLTVPCLECHRVCDQVQPPPKEELKELIRQRNEEKVEKEKILRKLRKKHERESERKHTVELLDHLLSSF